MAEGANMGWIRGGAAVSLFLAAGFALLRRWKSARVAAAFAAGFFVKWREARLAIDVKDALLKAGRDA